MDLDFLRKKLNALNDQTSTRKEDREIFWRPKDTHVIRILPYIHDLSDPFREIYNYYGMRGRDVITSPRTYGQADPIYEFAQKLQSTGNRDEYIMGKKLEPKRRTHVYILVRGQEEEGVKLWGFSDTVYKELVATMLDSDYGNIIDPQNGRDITVVYTPAANDKSLPKTTIRPKPNQTPITTDPQVMSSIQQMPAIETICKPPSYDELKVILENYLKAKDDSQTQNPGQEAQSTIKVQAPPSNPLDALSSLNSISNSNSNTTNPQVSKALSDFEKLFASNSSESEVPF